MGIGSIQIGQCIRSTVLLRLVVVLTILSLTLIISWLVQGAYWSRATGGPHADDYAIALFGTALFVPWNDLVVAQLSQALYGPKDASPVAGNKDDEDVDRNLLGESIQRRTVLDSGTATSIPELKGSNQRN